MAESETAYGGLVNPRSVPGILMGFSILLLLLTFAVGWYSVDATLRRYDHDPSNAQGDFVGPFLTPLYRIDLEMKMLSMSTRASPVDVERLIVARGEPSYDEHAGRMGTVMLGMLLMQFAVLISFVTTTAFYLMHRRRRADFAGVTKRLFIVSFVLVGLSLGYFGMRIGPAAQEDEEVILDEYPFNDQVAYAPLEPDLGFWKVWKSDKTTVTMAGDRREVWEFEVVSRPSAGWWLTVAAVGCAVAARILASRVGDFDRAEASVEAPPPPPSFRSPG